MITVFFRAKCDDHDLISRNCAAEMSVFTVLFLDHLVFGKSKGTAEPHLKQESKL